MFRWVRRLTALAATAVALGVFASCCMPASLSSELIVGPPLGSRFFIRTSLTHRDVEFESGGDTLRGWLFPATGEQKGLVIYLHGHADNRRRGEEVARRLGPLGYAVLTYDSRAHGKSDGHFCTYGHWEKRDLSRALDAVGARGAIVLGASMGGAVALQAAPNEPRICAIAAQAPFTDLDTAIRDRSGFFTESVIREAIVESERRAEFRFSEVSPVASAPNIHAPVLLLHGTADRETPPIHTERLLASLGGPKERVLIEGAGHRDIWNRAEFWEAVERWLARVQPACSAM